MSRAKIIFLAAVVLALSAVGVVAFVASHNSRPPVAQKEQTWFDAELKLAPEQREKIKAIWTGAMDGVMKKLGERRKSFKDERDAAFMEMLSPDQKIEWDQIQQQYANGVRDIDHERDQLFRQAMEQTKTILTPEQALKYQQMLNDRSQHGHHPSSPPGGMHRSGDNGSEMWRPDGRAPVHYPGAGTRP